MRDCYKMILCVPAALVLAGCASAPGESSAQTAEVIGPAGTADGLYEGEPEVVFATEFPVASVEDALLRAEAALKQGKTDLALYLYVRAYDLDRENLHALLRIAEIHRSRGNTGLASRALNGALKVDPKNAAALQSLGLMYLQARHYDAARDLLERAVAEEPELWRAQNGLGVLADMRDDYAAAVVAYDAALAANPEEPSLLNNRGYSRYLAGDYEAAANDFADAASLGVERAWLNLGLVFARQADYDKAVEMMSRIVAPEIAYNDVGYIAMRQGDEAVAATYFQKAIQMAPRYFEEAEKNLAELQQRESGESEEPVALLEGDVEVPAAVEADGVAMVADE